MRHARLVGGWAVATALVLGWLVLAPTVLGGSAAYATIHGISMEPRFHTGDLAVVRAADHYQVGDVVAYHSDLLKTVVMHRIVARDGAAFVLKGDNNNFLDPDHPAADQLIGKLAVRVPQGGVWLKRLTSPTALGLMAFALLAGGGTALQTRRNRKRRGTVSRHIERTHQLPSMNSLPPQLRTVATAAGVAGVLGAALGVFAWTGPTHREAMDEKRSGREVTFSYSAQVPRSAAYDGTTVRSPDPVFRTLAQQVDVHYAYRGEPGSVTVAVELSAASGWHSTLPLTQRTTFSKDHYDGTVSIDLRALERRAQKAATVIGMPADQVTATVRPRFLTKGGAVFTAELPLALNATRLTLEDASALKVKDQSTVQTATTSPRTLGLLGRQITIETARMLSLGLLVGTLLTAGLVAYLAHAGSAAGEGARIRRRYANLLVRVRPMPTPPGRPVVDVADFATLAKLAERYGLLVLHWSRSEVETFVVQDEGTTYRYRTAAEEGPSETDDSGAAPNIGRAVRPQPRSGEGHDVAARPGRVDPVETS